MADEILVYKRTDKGVKDYHLSEYHMTLEKAEYPSYDWYAINCIDDNDEVMGSIYFDVRNDKRKTWLRKIETDEKYAHKGIGAALLQVMEIISVKNRVTVIEGKYEPDNSYAEILYEKQGYHVPNKSRSWDDYDDTYTLTKILDMDEVIKNASHLEVRTKEVIKKR